MTLPRNPIDALAAALLLEDKSFDVLAWDLMNVADGWGEKKVFTEKATTLISRITSLGFTITPAADLVRLREEVAAINKFGQEQADDALHYAQLAHIDFDARPAVLWSVEANRLREENAGLRAEVERLEKGHEGFNAEIDRLLALMAKAVSNEREACAKVAAEWTSEIQEIMGKKYVGFAGPAASIRARPGPDGEKKDSGNGT